MAAMNESNSADATTVASLRQLIVIGDVHGCIDELKLLLTKCGWRHDRPSYQNPLIVFVGDLVAKGPSSCDVVAFCRRIGAYCVMGNHDHQVVKAAYLTGKLTDAVECGQARKPWVELGKDINETPSNMRVADEMCIDDLCYLANLPLTLEVPEYNVLVVHASLSADIGDRRMQEPGVCMFQRNVTEETYGSSDAHGTEYIDMGTHWADKWRGPRFAIAGHDATRRLYLTAHAAALDTGCCYGGKLTAIVCPGRHIVQVDALKSHAVQRSKIGVRNPKDNSRIRVEPVVEGPQSQLHITVSAQEQPASRATNL